MPPPAAPARRLLAFVVACLAALCLLWPAPLAPAQAARSLEDLIAPLAVGAVVARGYVLSPPRRGEEHDVIFSARRAAAVAGESAKEGQGDGRVFADEGANEGQGKVPGGGQGRGSGEGAAIELHVLDRGRWSGVRESRSFGIAYELPRSAAAIADCEAVTEAMAAAVRANDAGQWGPVEALRLRSEPPAPWLARALDRARGLRGAAIGLCLVIATLALASTPLGPLWSAAWLFALGLALRLPHLDLPFVRDQDVQRLFTGHLPLSQIVTGIGITDRHPPFSFIVLHLAQRFGQSEAIVRAPAALAGALLGPALVWSAHVARRRLDLAALAGLAATLSAPLVSRSREVSPIPLFAWLAIAMSVSLARHATAPTRGSAVTLAASHALALWTYYLAVFVIAGQLLALALLRHLPRELSRATAKPLAWGLVLGAPALALGVATFFRDRGARLAAELRPGLAWGDRSALATAGFLADTTLATFGPLLLAVLLAGVLWGVWRRDVMALVPMAAALLTGIAIVALAPVARVQPYYLVAVLPLVALSGALSLGAAVGRARTFAIIALAAAVVVGVAPHLHELRARYLPDPDAFMPAFAATVLDRPERRVITVAHYDATLLTYYLARHRHAPVDWASEEHLADGAYRLASVDRIIEPLVYSHAGGADPGQAAANLLDQRMRAEPVLVIERDAFQLPAVTALLRHCQRLAEAGTGRLWRCSAGP